MLKRYYILFRLTFLALFFGSAGAEAFRSNHSAPLLDTVPECYQAIKLAKNSNAKEQGLPDKIALLSWNIKKGLNPGWFEDLKTLSQNAELVLLQEAILIPNMQDPRDENIFWSFVTGYETDRYQSGVMTLSRKKPLFTCSLHSKEPWLRTPKSTGVTFFRLRNHVQGLLVINIHAINFSFGTKDLRAQLNKLRFLVHAHDGPIIFAGDLNTWSGARQELLKLFVKQSQLTPAFFDQDHRSLKFGREVDYVFVRGLRIRHGRVPKVDTSDHNPLAVTLEVN